MWRRGMVLVAGVAVVAIAACTSGTDPVSQGEVQQIINITTPAHAASTDTIRIAFAYVIPGCDTGAVLEARDENGSDFAGIRFTARSHPVDAPCPLLPTLPHAVTYSISPPHFAPMKLMFSEPDGNDTVRVVGP
ncbi:MAG: hypothetical protein ACJ79K_13105 [Gemmatimonadaceae bacterium]